MVEVYHVERWQPADPAHYPTRGLKAEDFRPVPGMLCTEFVGTVASAEIRKHYLGKSVRKHFTAGGLVFCKYGPDI